MLELIDESQIPSNYGCGTGKSLAESASGGGSESGAKSKMVVLNELLPLTKRQPEKSHNFELEDGKELTLTVYTRCKTGATASLFRAGNETPVTEINFAGEKEDEPYSRTIGAIVGPGSFTVKLKGKNEAGVFLVLGTTSASDESG